MSTRDQRHPQRDRPKYEQPKTGRGKNRYLRREIRRLQREAKAVECPACKVQADEPCDGGMHVDRIIAALGWGGAK